MMRAHRTRRLLAIGGIIASTAAFSCHTDADGGSAINGCKIVGVSGSWGDFFSEADWRIGPVFNSYTPDETAGCPIALAQPGERVSGGTLLYDYGTGTVNEKLERKAILRFINSRNQEKYYGEFFSRYFDTYVRSYEVFGQYAAATGTNSFGDKDFMNIRVVNPCCGYQLLAYLELELDYGADQGYRFNVAGTRIPAGNTSVTWNISSPSGGHPHAYTWYKNDVSMGQGSTYTTNVGTADFALRVEGVDTYGRKATAGVHVDVDGIIASLSGPSLVYSSQGGGTWTASVIGGSAPYTFQWFVDDQDAGEGDSFGGYPGEGGHRLKVRARDALGASSEAWMIVQGIGAGDGTCEPIPPAVTC